MAISILMYCSQLLYGKDACMKWDGLQVCIQSKGPCDLANIMSREKSKLVLDMFHVSILNISDDSIQIDPESFYGITESGHAIAMDPPLYQSIELKKKLQRKKLEPKEQVQGFLFFPASFGRIRTIVYSGDRYVEVQIF
jgi:hypothetical protein